MLFGDKEFGMSEGIMTAGGSIPISMIILLVLLAVICALCVYVAILKQHLIEEHERLEQLEKRVREQNRSNEVKQKFLFNMSHDIRTPMNAILGFANLAQRQMANGESADESLKYIEEAGNNLMEMLDGVLDTARLESNEILLQESLGDLEKTISRDLLSAEEHARNADITLTSSFKLKHKELYFDANVLRKILYNLVSNAIKYTEKDGKISVLVRETQSDKEHMTGITITISDNGIGISDSFKPHLFEPFSREKNTTMSGVEGTGLGLSAAKRMIEMMGGTITVNSTQGEGTDVIVSLAFRLPDEGETAEVSKERETHEASAVPEYEDDEDMLATKHSLNHTIHTVSAAIKEGISDDAHEAAEALPKKSLVADDYSFVDRRVLLAEDNKVNQKMEQLVLERAGIHVEIADDGQIAVNKVCEHPAGYYDAVLIDLQMPNMDGFEATAAIRALDDPDKANIPIIAVTANTSDADRMLSKEVGINGHLGKPIKILELLEVLQEYFDEI
jgi:signal transduction histidine kinase/ActR/RegA family two-component response regulator